METKFNCGKYKGKDISSAPLNYCEWFYENATYNPDPEIRKALAERLGVIYLPLPSQKDRQLTDFILGSETEL